MSEQPREARQASRLSASDSGAVAARDVYLSGTYVAGRDIVLQQPKPAPQALFQLPAEVADFTDRERELSDLRQAFERPPGGAPVVRVVAGKPGVGKSALAIRLAHQLKPRFPDAQLYVDLRGGDAAEELGPVEPGEVLADFVRALGVEEVPADPEQCLALYRAMLADKRALVVLDNASREQQVRPLIPGSGSCAVIVTSRSQLVGLEGVPPRRPLEVLEREAALELLARLLDGRERLEREPDAAEEIVRLCGRLPLGVRIAGARLSARPRWRLGRLVDRLADERRRLDELEAGDREVRASFALSYGELEPDEARLFRLLGLLRGPDFGAPLAAALLDAEQDEAEELLERLAEVQLLEPVGDERYGFHDLLRIFASERLETDEAADTGRLAAARALRWYLETADAASTLLQPMPEAEGLALAERRSRALSWFETERTNLVAAVDLAHLGGDWDATWRLAAELAGFFSLRAHWEDWRHTHELGLDAARRAGDRHAEAQTLGNLGVVYANQGRWDEAVGCYERSLEIFRELGDRHGEGGTLGNLGVVYGNQGRWEEAVGCYERSLEIFRELGDRHGEGQTLGKLGVVYRDEGRWDDAVGCYERSLEIFRELGDRHGEGQTLNNLGAIYRNRHRWNDALHCHEQSLEICRELGDRHGEAHALNRLGVVYRNQHRWDDAVDCYELSLEIFGELGHRHGEGQTLNNLGAVYRDQRRWDEAVGCYERSLEIFRELGDRQGEGQALANLGVVYGDQGRWDDAVGCYERSLEISRELGNRHGEGLTLANLGVVLKSSGRREEALASWTRAVVILEALGAPEADQVRLWLAA